jgi:hypothetical protein
MKPRLEISQEAELSPIEAIAQRRGGIEDEPRVDRQHGPSAIETLSLCSDPNLVNAPEGLTLPVRDIRADTGAEWLVSLFGDIMQRPGLGKTRAAPNVDIDADERTVGLSEKGAGCSSS